MAYEVEVKEVRHYVVRIDDENVKSKKMAQEEAIRIIKNEVEYEFETMDCIDGSLISATSEIVSAKATIVEEEG